MADSVFDLLMAKAMRAARYGDTTILITGETGTGKTWLARKIHENSPRSEKPFIEIDCTSIAQTIAESELFGHEKGAFTGAFQSRCGRIRAAEGGTILLDEIGDMDIGLQAKLLKVIEDRCVIPVGSEKSHVIDVRIIAATNRNLEALVERGGFRRDLFERLCQIRLTPPPLRERQGAVRALAQARLDEWNAHYGEAKRFDEGVFEALEDYGWPGNIRELRNAVDSACAQSPEPRIGRESLPLAVQMPVPKEYPDLDSADAPIPGAGVSLKEFMRGLERSFFRKALSISGGNAAKAAALLGMKGQAFRKALRERHSRLLARRNPANNEDASMEG